MRRFLYDTLVFIYALGVDHPHRDPCRKLVQLAADGRLRGEASVELIQEFLHVRHRRTGDRAGSAREALWVAALCVVHPAQVEDMRLAVTLFETVEGLHARDAVHAATALNRGIDAIVSVDTAFDGVPGLERIHVEDAPRVLA